MYSAAVVRGEAGACARGGSPFVSGRRCPVANLNKVMLIGRLTRDPEAKAFEGGGKVVSFGFAVNNRKKNNQTGAWEDVPVWIDCKAFDRAEGRKLATLIADTVKKGQQIFIEGRLTYEE